MPAISAARPGRAFILTALDGGARAGVPLSLIGNHFDRWLDLFEQTAREICPPAAAGLFIDKAHRIADSFEMASATVAGRIASPRHVLKS